MLACLLIGALLTGLLMGCNGTTGGNLKSTSDGSVLRINLASEPDYLDPAMSATLDGGTYLQNSFAGLFTTDSNGQIIPALCDTYEVSEDGLVYTFRLKDDLKWSDGSPLTAADFEYSWKRAADPQTGSPYIYLFDAFAKDPSGEINVSADGNVLTAVLHTPCVYFLDMCAFPTLFPVPQKDVEAADPDGTNPSKWASEAGGLSNGAYRLKEWKHNEALIYEKNPYFYNADKVKIEQLQFMLTADNTAAYAAYNSGDLDFSNTIPIDILSTVRNRADFHLADELGTYYLAFNVNADFFRGMSAEKAATVRKALCLLIDRDYIVKNIGQTGQELASSFIPYKMSDGNGKEFKRDGYPYPDEASHGYFPVDLTPEQSKQEAIRLLKSVGYRFDANGKLSRETPISFDYVVNTDSGHQAIAEALQSDWARIGVKVKIKTQEWSTYVADRRAGQFTCCRGGWVADFNDPITMLDLFASDSDNNYVQLGKNPDNPATPAWAHFDELIDEIKSTNDRAYRVELMHEAETMVMDSWAVIPIYYYNVAYLCKTNVKGIYSTLFGMKFFCYAWIDS